MKISYDWRGMPIEFTQYPPQENTGVFGDTLYKMAMAYDGTGRRISKTRARKEFGGDWETELVTHYTGIGTEVRENPVNGETKVVVNLPNGLGRYMPEDASAGDFGFGARYLDPMLGMWTSVDPARQFASPYLYAGNGYNPVNAIDPDGNVTVGVQFNATAVTPSLVSAKVGTTYSIMIDFDRFLHGEWPILYATSGEVGGGVSSGGAGISLGLFASSDSPKLGAYETRRYDVNMVAGGGVGISLSPGDDGRYDASMSFGLGANAFGGGGVEFGYIDELRVDKKMQDMIENPTDYAE